jgi:REP element-mobilizing transposase RayT
MARRAREDFPNTTHHVCNRAVDGRQLFVDDDDPAFMLSLLTRWCAELGIECLGWCFPGNHLHLLLTRAEHSIADFMQRVLSAYASYFNRKYGRVGHVVQRRYESRRIEDDGDLRWQLAYTLGNRVRHALTTSAQLPDDVLTGYAGAMGLRPALAFEAWTKALRAFDDDPVRAREALRELIVRAEANQWRRASVTPEEIIAAVCYERGTTCDALRSASPVTCDARAEIVRRATTAGRMSRSEIASALGVGVDVVDRSLRRSSRMRITPD